MAVSLPIETVRAALEQALVDANMPTPIDNTVSIRQATGWEVRFLPPSMSPGEYASVFIKDFTTWWDPYDLSALIEGETVPISIGAENEGAFWGMAIYVGHKDEAYDAPPETRKWDWVGGPHAHVTLTGMEVYINGVGPGRGSSPVGTVIRGHEFLLTFVNAMDLPFRTAALGTLETNIRVSPDGVRVFTNPTFTNADARVTSIYPTMPVVTTPDIYEDAVRTIAIGPDEATGDSANLGPQTEYRFKWSARPNLICRVVLPRGGTGPGINDWAAAVGQQAMLQKHAKNPDTGRAVRKLYLDRVNCAPVLPANGASDVLIKVEKL